METERNSTPSPEEQARILEARRQDGTLEYDDGEPNTDLERSAELHASKDFDMTLGGGTSNENDDYPDINSDNS